MKLNTAKLKRRSSPRSWLAFSSATDEIKLALGVIDEVAAMILQGLCATGNVLATDSQQQLIDPEECTIATYEVQVAYVNADDLRYWLSACTAAPQQKLLDSVIRRMRDDHKFPGRNVTWKKFNDEVRDCPSSKFLRQRAVQIREAPARLFNEVTRLAVGVASGVV
jgi:hypothetical protein